MTREQIRKFLPKEEWLGFICYCAATLWIDYVRVQRILDLQHHVEGLRDLSSLGSLLLGDRFAQIPQLLSGIEIGIWILGGVLFLPWLLNCLGGGRTGRSIQNQSSCPRPNGGLLCGILLGIIVVIIHCWQAEGGEALVFWVLYLLTLLLFGMVLIQKKIQKDV